MMIGNFFFLPSTPLEPKNSTFKTVREVVKCSKGLYYNIPTLDRKKLPLTWGKRAGELGTLKEHKIIRRSIQNLSLRI